MEDMERLRKKLDENRISLNEDVRRNESMRRRCARKRARKNVWPGRRKNRRVYRLTLDTVDKPNLQLIMFPGKIAEAKTKAA